MILAAFYKYYTINNIKYCQEKFCNPLYYCNCKEVQKGNIQLTYLPQRGRYVNSFIGTKLFLSFYIRITFTIYCNKFKIVFKFSVTFIYSVVY